MCAQGADRWAFELYRCSLPGVEGRSLGAVGAWWVRRVVALLRSSGVSVDFGVLPVGEGGALVQRWFREWRVRLVWYARGHLS